MSSARASGILLHPTCFPGRFGIGDLGPEAYRFVDWLAGAAQQLWQVLPLDPTGGQLSPYESLCVFAGNPLLISPQRLADEGLLDDADLDAAAGAEVAARVDFAKVSRLKDELLDKAWANFGQLPASHLLRSGFDRFCRSSTEWLDDYATFMALREANHFQPWIRWSRLVTDARRPSAEVPAVLADRIGAYRFRQWVFFRQWDALRTYARGRGIRILGDLPIYVSADSADVWANRSLFQLDERGSPTAVAGVPPDYFCSTGQLWGNPLYDWEAMRRDGFAWWVRRVHAALRLADLVRLDHFRGYEAYWSVPAGHDTAEEGTWIEAPGAELFEAIRRALAEEPAAADSSRSALPLLAEDLGMITPEVTALRKRFGLPGMKVLQFMLGGSVKDPFEPDAFDRNTVVYTGTHDNDTTRGWFRSDVLGRPAQLGRLRQYAQADVEQIAWELIRLAWESSADVAIAPWQDVLSLESSARMNKPGTTSDEHPNWSWRYPPHALCGGEQLRLAALTRRTNRAG